jgi:hypothetical protein
MEQEITQVRIPDTTELAARSASVTSIEFRQFKITDAVTYGMAVERYRGLQDLDGAIVDNFREEKTLAHKLHRVICDKEGALLKPVREVAAYYNREITRWDLEEKRKAEDERRKAEAKALKEAERDKEKEAKALERSGEAEAADHVRSQPVAPPVVARIPTIPQMKGVGQRNNYRHKVIDFQGLVKAVAAGRVPIQALQPNDTFLNQQARSLKESLDYPGVRVVNQVSAQIRRA